MNCPKCNFEQEASNTECIKCGIVFEKYKQPQESETVEAVAEVNTDNIIVLKEPSETGFLNLLLYTKENIDPIYLGGRAVAFLIIFIWGWKFIFTPINHPYLLQTNMHLINLPFHEAGHLVFRPFGQFISSLGGSLGQILIPLMCLGTLLLKTRDTFGASVTLWWTGQNFIDLAPYINDARTLTMPLLGGNTGRFSPYGFHDWEFILTESGLLQHDHFIAGLSFTIGSILIILSFVWGGFLLYKQYRNLEKS
ncbi:hypothetical protein BMS3Abin09_00743 [bacterium BMS3Abin09]|nr:hypothetical protein BMS3Abin09_00743 [bacterium BMS3Abin09]